MANPAVVPDGSSIDAIHPDDIGHALIAGAAAPVIGKLPGP
jgi:hypothetical protein